MSKKYQLTFITGALNDRITILFDRDTQCTAFRHYLQEKGWASMPCHDFCETIVETDAETYKNTRLDYEILDLHARLQGSSVACESLARDLASTKSCLSQLQSECSTLESERDTLKHDLKDANQAIRLLRGACARLESSVSELRESLLSAHRYMSEDVTKRIRDSLRAFVQKFDIYDGTYADIVDRLISRYNEGLSTLEAELRNDNATSFRDMSPRAQAYLKSHVDQVETARMFGNNWRPLISRRTDGWNLQPYRIAPQYKIEA